MRYLSGYARAWQHDAGMRELCNRIVREGLPAEAEIIYSGRNRVARLAWGDRSLIIKEFRQPNLINRYIYTTLRRSKARRSLENAERLRASGFGSPEPMAWMEARHGLCLHLSYYICEEVQGKDLRFLDRNEDTPELLPALAEEMGRLHRAGVWHKDFSPGNVIYRREQGKFRFYYIDLNRMEFDVHDSGKLLRNFRALARTEEVAEIGRLYAPYSPFSLTADEGEAVARRERAYFLKRHPKVQD